MEVKQAVTEAEETKQEDKRYEDCPDGCGGHLVSSTGGAIVFCSNRCGYGCWYSTE